jgi:hypothetical protein
VALSAAQPGHLPIAAADIVDVVLQPCLGLVPWGGAATAAQAYSLSTCQLLLLTPLLLCCSLARVSGEGGAQGYSLSTCQLLLLTSLLLYRSLSCSLLGRPCQNSTTRGRTKKPPQWGGFGTGTDSSAYCCSSCCCLQRHMRANKCKVGQCAVIAGVWWCHQNPAVCQHAAAMRAAHAGNNVK